MTTENSSNANTQTPSTPAKQEGGEIRMDTPNPKKAALLAAAGTKPKKAGAVKKVAAKKTAAPKAAAKKPAPKAVSGKKPTPAKSAVPAKGAAGKKPAAKAPAKKGAGVAKKVKGQVGGFREGSGRKSVIKDKKRQTIDFTGDHKKRLGVAKLQKHFEVEGVSPLIRVLLDRFLPVLEKEAGVGKK